MIKSPSRIFDFIILFILILQIAPLIYMDRLEGETAWLIFDTSVLSVISLQACYIYASISFHKRLIKLVSLTMFLVSLWFLYDYVYISLYLY